MAKSGSPVLLALLRGINVGGNKKVPMETLKKLSEKAGFTSVKTYINSGNVLFRTDEAPAKVEAILEKALEKEFGFRVDVVVRTADAWEQYAKKSGFPDVEETRPNLLMLGVSKLPVAKGAADALNALAKDGERVKQVKDALWIDYAEAIGRSKLTPAALDKHTGSPVTGRNWNTVQKLAVLARELE